MIVDGSLSGGGYGRLWKEVLKTAKGWEIRRHDNWKGGLNWKD